MWDVRKYICGANVTRRRVKRRFNIRWERNGETRGAVLERETNARRNGGIKRSQESTYGARGALGASGGVPVVREYGVFVERMLEMEEYRVLSDERGGAVQMDIIENGGRQYKSRTTYSESCWGKWMRMSAAGSRQERKKKKN